MFEQGFLVYLKAGEKDADRNKLYEHGGLKQGGGRNEKGD
jgi:hypothetical protein